MLCDGLSAMSLNLKNRLGMSPVPRCRAMDNVPYDLMARYYGPPRVAAIFQ